MYVAFKCNAHNLHINEMLLFSEKRYKHLFKTTFFTTTTFSWGNKFALLNRNDNRTHTFVGLGPQITLTLQKHFHLHGTSFLKSSNAHFWFKHPSWRTYFMQHWPGPGACSILVKTSSTPQPIERLGKVDLSSDGYSLNWDNTSPRGFWGGFYHSEMYGGSSFGGL